MASYRFCRPDDIPYLVRAVNECWNVHFPDQAPMTVERYRDEMKHLDVWPSNSMVASSDAGPLAVMIGTKRAREVRVLRLGVRPDHQRQGHGVHLLTSLSHKLAVLGPERLVVELPESLGHLGPFLEAAGYHRETAFTDHERPAEPAAPVAAEWLQPISMGDALGFLEPLVADAPLAWRRQPESLRALGDEADAIAFASPARLEACMVAHTVDDGVREILALAALPGPDATKFCGLLLRRLTAEDVVVRWPKLSDAEVASGIPAALGFHATTRHELWAAEADPA